ncbi:I78 family peptidase inhibitor [Streptomyces sp. NPDC003691]
MAPDPHASGEPDDSTGAYVGMSGGAAERRARSRGWSTVRSLPPGAIITLEYQRGRLNFEVEHDTVIRCWRG